MILVALNVLTFCMMWTADLHEEFIRELELMSTSAWRVIWWIPLSLFVHGDLSHLTTNMLILALVSWKLEPRIERKHFVGIFLFSGVVSDGVILAFMRLESLPILFLGASGAVLGLVARGRLFAGKPTDAVYDQSAVDRVDSAGWRAAFDRHRRYRHILCEKYTK